MVVGLFLTTIGQKGLQFPCHVFSLLSLRVYKGKNNFDKEGRWWWQELSSIAITTILWSFQLLPNLKGLIQLRSLGALTPCLR